MKEKEEDEVTLLGCLCMIIALPIVVFLVGLLSAGVFAALWLIIKPFMGFGG